MLTHKSYAKINLTLEVLGRRDDGYHDVATIMQTIDLHDTVRLTPADDITLSCDDPLVSLTSTRTISPSTVERIIQPLARSPRTVSR